VQRAITRGETLGWLFRRVLILAAPFVWRKYTEQAKEQGQQHAQQAGQLANRGSEPTITDTVERLGRVTEEW
jgi:hypothetical protein